MSDISLTELWFKRAVKVPAEKQQVQVGVHFEECSEMLEAMRGKDPISEKFRADLEEQLKLFATALKTGNIALEVVNRKDYVDACADQIVTAVGSAFVYGCNAPLALERVNTSNFSKFDEHGMPVFDANGKIAKNKATYKEADFTGCY